MHSSSLKSLPSKFVAWIAPVHPLHVVHRVNLKVKCLDMHYVLDADLYRLLPPYPQEWHVHENLINSVWDSEILCFFSSNHRGINRPLER